MNRFPSFRWFVLAGIAVTAVVLVSLLAPVATAVAGAHAVAPAEPVYQLGPRWASFFCVGYEQCGVGDFNGDGKADIVTFLRDTQTAPDQGDAYVSLSTGYTFMPATKWHDNLCVGYDICKIADADGDGWDDVIVFSHSPTSGRVYVALSLGTSFAPLMPWNNVFCVGEEVCDVGNLNGDGFADIVAFTRSTTDPQGRVWVAVSNGSEFVSSRIWNNDFTFCIEDEQCDVGDADGDGLDDVMAFVKSGYGTDADGDVYVALSDGVSFPESKRAKWNDLFCLGNETCDLGDFDGDGKDDAIAFLRSNYSDKIGDVTVALSKGSSFPSATKWHDDFCLDELVCTTGDFSGDGRDDIISFVRSVYLDDRQGDVYVALSAWPRPAFVYLGTNHYLPLLMR